MIILKITKWIVFFGIIASTTFLIYYWDDLQEISNNQALYEENKAKISELPKQCLKGIITNEKLSKMEVINNKIKYKGERIKIYFDECSKGMFAQYSNKVCYEKGIDKVKKEAKYIAQISKYFSKENCNIYLNNKDIFSKKRQIIKLMEENYLKIEEQVNRILNKNEAIGVKAKIKSTMGNLKKIINKEKKLFNDMLINDRDMYVFVHTIKEMDENEKLYVKTANEI